MARVWKLGKSGNYFAYFSDGKRSPKQKTYPLRTTRKDVARRKLAKLDERLHFHSLRHTTASWLAMKGVPMRVIAGILGHSSTAVTEQYSHLAPDAMRAAMSQTFGG